MNLTKLLPFVNKPALFGLPALLIIKLIVMTNKYSLMTSADLSNLFTLIYKHLLITGREESVFA